MGFRFSPIPWKAALSALRVWQWPVRWRALWAQRFPDLRVIVDREGQLTYLSISGTLQQWAVRTVLVAATAASVLVAGLAATTVWLHLGNRALTVIDDCLQFFGGYGYMLEYPVTRAFMDARVQRIYAGTNEIMKVIIAKQMGL